MENQTKAPEELALLTGQVAGATLDIYIVAWTGRKVKL